MKTDIFEAQKEHESGKSTQESIRFDSPRRQRSEFEGYEPRFALISFVDAIRHFEVKVSSAAGEACRPERSCILPQF